MKIDDTNTELERKVKDGIISRLYEDKASRFDDCVKIIEACRDRLNITLDLDEAYLILQQIPGSYRLANWTDEGIIKYVLVVYTDEEIEHENL